VETVVLSGNKVKKTSQGSSVFSGVATKNSLSKHKASLRSWVEPKVASGLGPQPAVVSGGKERE